MASPGDRDPVDAWLNAEVETLAPRPGTFERIRHRARRRKAAKAVMSGAGIVIVVAAAVAVPRISSTFFQSHNVPSHGVAAGPSSRPRPTPASRANESLNAKSPTAFPTQGTSSLGTPGNPVPPNFQPTSVTFVSLSTGAVIGQAGTPGHCAIIPTVCTSLAGTSDHGIHWYGVSAPLTGAPDGSHGVGQLRFLNARDGWAFGPELWVRHDGGAQWKQEQTYGMRVTDLETAGDRAFAIFATCKGTGPSYAADCSSPMLFYSPTETDQWRPVPIPNSTLYAYGPGPGPGPASGSLVLSDGTGYMMDPSGTLLRGPLTGGFWTKASPPVNSRHGQCLPGAPGPSGRPAGALLAANAKELVLVCTSGTSPAGDTQVKDIVASTDGGAHWSAIGTAPAPGIATSVAIQAQDNLVLLATDSGLYRSANGGRSWQLAQPSPGGAAAGKPGFSYVGMTSPAQGVALPADARLGLVFITTDGGASWQAHRVSAP